MTIDTPPRRTNPHQLTIKQHTLPLRSIERFCHENQAVKVKLNTKDIFIDLKPNNSLFCANRAWDHRTETVVSKDIESNFQNLADKINSRLIRAMCTEDQLTVTHMYLLWKYRCKLASNPIADVKINLVTPERELSIDSKEVLEKKGIVYIQSNGTIAGRVFSGINIQRAMDIELTLGAEKLKWGIIKSPIGVEFIVPDASINQAIMPISPSTCLIAGLDNCELTIMGAGLINRAMIFESQKYWFARNPNRCPILQRCNPWIQTFGF